MRKLSEFSFENITLASTQHTQSDERTNNLQILFFYGDIIFRVHTKLEKNIFTNYMLPASYKNYKQSKQKKLILK